MKDHISTQEALQELKASVIRAIRKALQLTGGLHQDQCDFGTFTLDGPPHQKGRTFRVVSISEEGTVQGEDFQDKPCTYDLVDLQYVDLVQILKRTVEVMSRSAQR